MRRKSRGIIVKFRKFIGETKKALDKSVYMCYTDVRNNYSGVQFMLNNIVRNSIIINISIIDIINNAVLRFAE